MSSTGKLEAVVDGFDARPEQVRPGRCFPANTSQAFSGVFM